MICYIKNSRSTALAAVKFQGRVISEKKAPARQPRVVVGIQERVISEKKGPCQATAGCRRNEFLQKSVQIQDLHIKMEKYPTQNDATDHIYRLGPPKPIFLFKMN